MSKVLITGGAGTIGYFLGKSLVEQGDDITLVDNLFRGKLDSELKKLLQKPSIKLIELDICDLLFTTLVLCIILFISIHNSSCPLCISHSFIIYLGYSFIPPNSTS